MARGSRFTVTIEGGEELLEQLQRMGVDVKAALEKVVLEGAEEIRRPANQMAPGPHVVAEVAASGKQAVTVAIGQDKEHWYYQFFETGAQPHEITGSPIAFEGREGAVITGRVDHTGMAARPFLRPAFDRRKGAAEQRVGEGLKRVIEP